MEHNGTRPDTQVPGWIVMLIGRLVLDNEVLRQALDIVQQQQQPTVEVPDLTDEPESFLESRGT